MSAPAANNAMQTQTRTPTKTPHWPWRAKLWPWQKKAGKWMVERERDSAVRGGILADEPGLGKTYEVAAVMAATALPSTLVIVPGTVVLAQWRQVFVSACGIDPLVLTAKDLRRAGAITPALLRSKPIVMTTYSAFSTASAAELGPIDRRAYPKRENWHDGIGAKEYAWPECPLYAIAWDRIVLDEYHQCAKNPFSKTHQLLLRVPASIKWLVTGTPVTRNKDDFRDALRFMGVQGVDLDTDLAAMARRFVLRRTAKDIFGTPEHQRATQAALGQRLPTELVERVADMAGGLPPLSREDIAVPFRHREERDLYAILKQQGQVLVNAFLAAGELGGGGGGGGAAEGRALILKQLLRMRQAVTNPQLVLDGEAKERGGPPQAWPFGCSKLEVLVEQLAAQPAGEKAIVVCHWTGEIAGVCRAVRQRLGWHPLRLDGQTKSQDRPVVLEEFSTRADRPILVIQMAVGGTGLNIQAANHVYINSLDYAATQELQAIARAHRLGQTRPVFVKRLVIQDSIDTAVTGIQNRKLGAAADVLSDDRLRTALSPCTFDELLAAFD